MIITHKDTDFTIKIGKYQKYSNNYTFIPIDLKKNKQNSLIQTPHLFVPFGIKNIDNKQLIDISFLNLSNDKDVELFYNFIIDFEKYITNKFTQYKVNNILKNTDYHYCMRLKIINSTFFNHHKQKINNIKNNSYARFIIDIHGLWLYNNEIWFQWYVIQAEIREPVIHTNYLFDEKISKPPLPPPPPPPPITVKL